MIAISLIGFCFLGFAVGHECFQDWVYYNGSCYGFGESAVTWGDAQTICQTFGANLVKIESAGEDMFLANISRTKQSASVWLGATDIFKEGTWLWSATHDPLNGYSNWAPNEPNDMRGGEDCLNFYGVLNYRWNDSPCHTTSNFICETVPMSGPISNRIIDSERIDILISG